MELENITNVQSVNEDITLIQIFNDENYKAKKEVNQLRNNKPYLIKTKSKFNTDNIANVSNVDNIDFDISSTQKPDLYKNDSCKLNTNTNYSFKNLRNEKEKNNNTSKFFSKDKKTIKFSEKVSEMKTTKEKNFHTSITNTNTNSNNNANNPNNNNINNYFKNSKQIQNITKAIYDNDEIRRQKKSGTLAIQSTRTLLDEFPVFELAKNM